VGRPINIYVKGIVKHVITHSNLFTYYEQDVAKFILFIDYYDNVYQGGYENW
jgi:hypothetical protein